MDKEIKLLLGKVLGEIYEIKNALPQFKDKIDDDKIYALKNGFEFIIDKEVFDYKVSTEECINLVDTISPIFYNKDLDEVSKYKNIEEKIKGLNFDKEKLDLLFEYFYKKGAFKSISDIYINENL